MGTYEFIIAITAIALGGGIIKSVIAKRGGGTKELEARIRKLGLDEKIARLEDLEERIGILERIVTSNNNSLADEIDGL